ncbi:streptophobe family protein [Streptomyces sp900129855]|uniref:Streptophobe family protein n=1 Tax=Streptomyces sp. 900129855 TaxID=3155129 RepID=A0ABV2ZAF9_9ACTN
MSAGTDVEGSGSAARGGSVPWTDVLLAAVTAVSWALIGMAGTAALGLHLLEADSAGSLGPMTAAVVALGAGGSVTPSGDVSAFGLTGTEADTAIEITPLGVSLVGALLLSWFFLRSLRAAGVVIAPAELLARVGTVVALFVAMLGGLVWAGHDVITFDGGALGLDDLAGGGGSGGGGGGAGGGGGLEIPGLGDVGDIAGLLPDRLGGLVDAKAAVGFTVDLAPTVLGGLGWCVGILLIALLASRRTPLPRGWEAVHRVVRPAVSAVVTVLLVAVAAGFAAAAYAAIGDDHPRRIAGAALLGAPNGVWLGIPIGLFVPWDGHATGALTNVLPHPLDDLLKVGTDQWVTLPRLAELDSRVWLLGVATALTMLLAGVLTAIRTPLGGTGFGGGPTGGAAPAGLGVGASAAAAAGRGAGSGAGSGPGSGARAGRGAGSGAGPGAGPGAGSGTGSGAEAGPGAGRWSGSGAGPGWGAGSGAGPGAEAGPGAGSGAGPGAEAGPRAGKWSGSGSGAGSGSWGGVVGFGGRCAVRLGVVNALALTLLVWLTEVSVNASLSVLGFDAFGAGLDLRGHLGTALLLGAAWGAGAGGVGALLACASGAAGRRAAPLARGVVGSAAAEGPGEHRGLTGAVGERVGPYAPSASYRPPNPATNPYLRLPEEVRDARPEAARGDGGGEGDRAERSRPYESSRRGEPPATGGRPPEVPPGRDDVYGAPTVVRPIGPPPRSPRRPPGSRPSSGPDERQPPPPPPPPSPPPPRRPRGSR